jgi:predicted transcriptional regulator
VVVVQYRNRLTMISDLLLAALSSGSEGGASSSTLMRRCNLSYRGLEALAGQLIEAGLLRRLEGERSVRYVVSEKGCAYLEQVRQFEAFSESYGLRL